ncbi:hypothetical protein NBRC3257_2179 [Gluconobacter thailandicus NBRC 3257]|uniref:Phytase-like domain-containing protein n=1 Tax=Gluconobacter thailandicus NBRC 3257 TaxID=1381097 RepID=A0ABQ0IYA8_GLUTH|nr:hypothetical protein NBRC3255_2192 [Gluconobacter thailandicus NBRC 3255]GAD27180.1 hypothetical protein NBRC3257_2179 [Gluconobacter thailandicus NBRC 3257]
MFASLMSACLVVVSLGKVQAHDVLKTPENCIKAAVVLPLLGGPGDSPIIPVKVNGLDAAMYVSPMFGHVMVHDSGKLWFPLGADMPLKAQNGAVTLTSRTLLDDVQIGPMDLGEMRANLLDGQAERHVGSRPLIGMLGLESEIFSGTDILFDVPNGKLAFLKFRTDKACKDAAHRLMGAQANVVELRRGALIAVRANARSQEMVLDPDLSETVLPTSWGDGLNLTSDDIRHEPIVTTQYVGVSVGHQYVLNVLDIGGYNPGPLNVLFQSDISTAALGGDVFRKAAVLLDRDAGQAFFLPETENTPRPTLHFHFDESRLGHTTVTQKTGRIETGVK